MGLSIVWLSGNVEQVPVLAEVGACLLEVEG